MLQTIKVTVRAILPDMGMANFTLKPTPEPVRNAFVPIRFLQNKIDRADRANGLLLGPTQGACNHAWQPP